MATAVLRQLSFATALATILLSTPSAAQSNPPAPLTCPAGQAPARDASGNSLHCCWPDQMWSGSSARCVGPPTCPAELVAMGPNCICEGGRIAMANHCCWPEQMWSPSASRCVGPPRCPAGLEAIGPNCVGGIGGDTRLSESAHAVVSIEADENRVARDRHTVRYHGGEIPTGYFLRRIGGPIATAGVVFMVLGYATAAVVGVLGLVQHVGAYGYEWIPFIGPGLAIANCNGTSCNLAVALIGGTVAGSLQLVGLGLAVIGAAIGDYLGPARRRTHRSPRWLIAPWATHNAGGLTITGSL